MSDKKQIDRLFQEAFKDFEATPRDAVWNNIEAKLNQKKNKRRVIPIWWRYAGVAALLLLLLTIGNGMFKASQLDVPNQVVETEVNSNTILNKNETPLTPKQAISVSDINVSNDDLHNTSDNITEVSKNEDPLKANKAISNTPLNALNQDIKNNDIATIADETSSRNQNRNTNKSKDLKEASKNDANTINKPILQSQNNALVVVDSKENNTTISETDKAALDTNKTSTIINTPKNNPSLIVDSKNTGNQTVVDEVTKNNTLTIEDVLEEKKFINKDEKETLINRWSVAPNAAPVYFNTLGEGSSIDSQFNNNSKSSETNMSYGITAAYAINKKLSIRSGINKVNLGYNTNDVVVFATLGQSSSLANVLSGNERVSNTDTAENVSLVSAGNVSDNKIPSSIESNSNTAINQSLGYIEVPLEIQYILSDKKLGVNVIGGFSSFFLNHNKLYSEAQGNRTYIGEATNINNVSYSANLGLGLNYKMTKTLHLNLEPMFKYQINTFNNTSGNFTPYFIGVYTGIGFKF
jgi:hypothetical protein